MTIGNLTDLHGNLRHLERIENELRAADLIILSGDITHFAGAEEAERMVSALLRLNGNLLAVTGNCDQPDVARYLRDRNLSIEGRCIQRNGVFFGGLGGSLPGPMPTPNTSTEEELAIRLEELELPDESPFVLVSHQPPFDTATDVISSGRHVGSHSVRGFLEHNRVVVCLTGHIHESVGRSTVEGCMVVNPGPFSGGYYAMIELDTRGAHHVELLRV